MGSPAGAKTQPDLSALEVPLNRDLFLRNLVRHLAGTLEDVVGLREAAGFISVVGQAIGGEMNCDYRAALRTPELSRQQVAAVLVDLKWRIEGDFYVIEESEGRVVEASERAAHLTRQMLAYSGRGQFIVQRIGLSDAVRELLPLLSMSIPKRST